MRESERRNLLKTGDLVSASSGAQRVDIPAGAPAPSTRFSEHLISNDYTYGYGIAAADLDGDGDVDLTSSDCTTRGSKIHNDIYWFENDGKGNFTRHSIWSEARIGRFERHRIADINRDGYPDLVVVDNFHGDVIWFENSGHPGDGKPWRRHPITEGGLLGAYDVDIADLDGDGWPDVVASSWRMGNQFMWFRNPRLKHDSVWEARLIDANLAETRTVRVGDFNGDGHPDVLGTVTGAGIVLWYENPGPPVTGPWRRHVIDLPGRPCHGEPADIDGDGDLDVVMALGFHGDWSLPGSGAQIVWYENIGNPGDGTKWEKHVVWEGFEDAFEAIAADVDGDGHMDIIATAYLPGMVAWLKNPNSPTGSWSLHVVKQGWQMATQPIAADLDRDGRLDIAVVNELGREFRWWRNMGK